jgi:hypothetical protein
VQQAYSGGYEHPIEVGGAVSTPLVLSPYGGWHGGCGNEEFVFEFEASDNNNSS